MENNYFELFGLKSGVELDLNGLNQKYLALQALYHPDKFVGKSEAEKQEAMKKSTLINRAYGVLKDRFKRAEYLLGELEVDQKTLIEIMELRENQNAGTVAEVRKQVSLLFDEMAENYNGGKRDEATKKFVKIKYLNKFLEDATANT